MGDDAYVIVDMKAFEAAGGFEESDEPCELCGGVQQSDANLLLECERCLRGFHMACLDTPLSAVPEVGRKMHSCSAGVCALSRLHAAVHLLCSGWYADSPALIASQSDDLIASHVNAFRTSPGIASHELATSSALPWLTAFEPRQDTWECPSCAAGKALPPPRPRACTLREKYLGGAAGVELARIRGLWKDPAVGKAGFAFRGQWYERPENTHCGRQARPRTLRTSLACAQWHPLPTDLLRSRPGLSLTRRTMTDLVRQTGCDESAKHNSVLYAALLTERLSF